MNGICDCRFGRNGYLRAVALVLCLVASVVVGPISYGRAAADVQTLYARWHDMPTARLMDMGRDFDLADSPDSALVCYSIVSDRLTDTKMNDEEGRVYVRSLVNLAYIYGSYFFDYSKSLGLLQTAAEKSKSMGYTENLAYVYLNMGGVYLACNQIYGNRLFSDEIWKYLDMSITAGVESGAWQVVLVSITNICSLYPEDPRKDKFLVAASRVEKADIPPATPMREYTSRLLAGTKAYVSGDYEAALRQFQTLEGLIPDNEMQAGRYRCIAWTALADALSGLGRYAEAIEVTEKVLAVSRREYYDDEAARALHKLSQYNYALGDTGKAEEYLLSYYSKKDSIVSEREVANLSSMPLTSEINNMAREIKLEREKKQRVLIGICVAVLFILLLVLYLVRVVSSNRKLRDYSKQIYRKYMDALESEKREKVLRESLESFRQQEKEAAADVAAETPPKERYSNSTIPLDVVRDITEKIEQVLSDNDVISDPKFSLHQLSDAVGYSYKMVSQVINESLGKNFKTLLNEHRIKEACSRLVDGKNYGGYTIEHIAQSVGFVSRSNFSVAFKAVVGITPSEFQRNAREDIRSGN